MAVCYAQALVGLIGALRQSCGDNLSGTTKTKRTTGATDGPKSFEGFCRVSCQLTARRLACCLQG